MFLIEVMNDSFMTSTRPMRNGPDAAPAIRLVRMNFRWQTAHLHAA
jgi:hypothetical protein